MKQRLFWKILIGFWVTIFIVIQLVWVAYYLILGDASSRARAAAEAIAPYQITAARLAIEMGGVEKLREVAQEWPAADRDRLTTSQNTGNQPASGNADMLHAQTIAPDSTIWNLDYQLPPKDGITGSVGDFFRFLFYIPLDWAIPSILGGLLFSAVLAWYLTRPILFLRRGFRSLADGQLNTRLQPKMGRRRDEIADLAKDFDRMAERLQQSVLARDQLLHDVSHELRSPLARLSLAVALLRQNATASQESLQRIDTEVGRLDQLVGELLSLSRHESGEVDLDDAYFDMRTLLEAIVADARFEARAKGVDITLQFLERPPVLLRGSAELIRRATENIIRNAVQFSKRDQTVDVRLEVHGSDPQEVVVQIGDRGPGIPEEKLEYVLEPFVRLPGDRAREGYGLGLAIARRAIQSHRGTLVVSNRTGGGLAVTISLPLVRVDPALMDLAG